MEQILASEPPQEPLPPRASSPIQKNTADGHRMGGSFISHMIDSAAQTVTSVTLQETVDTSVTGGQGGNLDD